MCQNIANSRFADIGRPNTVWSISAIHGEVDALISLHDALYDKIQPGDKLIYLGNYIGYGTNAVACIDEILTFRRLLLAKPSMMAKDIIYLRGGQEEMWQKILELQFAPCPSNVLLWMLGNGLSSTLQAYGLCPHDGIEACASGVMGITKWTNKIREAIRKHPGHETFGTQLLRAAHTDKSSTYPMLFVHAGLESNKALNDQGDSLWWDSGSFAKIDQAYKPFEKVVRGYDPSHSGVHLNCITATIDGGCGFGGNLVAAGFQGDGSLTEIIET